VDKSHKAFATLANAKESKNRERGEEREKIKGYA